MNRKGKVVYHICKYQWRSSKKRRKDISNITETARLLGCREFEADNRELLQGDAASYVTQEATNLEGTAFFGPLWLTSAFANERRSLAVYCLCKCIHERIPSPGKVSDWLTLQLRRTSRTTLISAITVLDSKGTHGFKLVTMQLPKFAHDTHNITLALPLRKLPNSPYGVYVTRHWNWTNRPSYWMFWIGRLRGARSELARWAVSAIFEKWPFVI